jgi:predicted phage terminase large subunit-like protein
MLDDKSLAKLSPAGLAVWHSKGTWKYYKHLDPLNRGIMDVAAGRLDVLVGTMPPRHGKSELVSRYTPAWYEGIFPERNVILASYEADFAESWGRKARDVLAETAADIFNIELDPIATAGKSWRTKAGGGMFTAGVGGPMTGKGAHLMIIDDPTKNMEEAMSQTYREKAWDWYRSVAFTRLEPGGGQIIIMTRWHEDDIVGKLLKELAKQRGLTVEQLEQNKDPRVRVIAFPALAEDNDPIGRQPGEALCPERYDVPALTNIQGVVGPYIWESLYQQHPTTPEGGIFKRSYWKFYGPGRDAPLPRRFDEMIQSWDMTFKDTKSSDFVVGQVWGRKGADKFLLFQVRKRLSFVTTVQAVKMVTKLYPRATKKLVEDKANGPAVISTLRSKISGLIEVNPQGGKEARAVAVSPQVAAGNVWLPHPEDQPWVQDYINEHANFPRGANDDQVDATSQALFDLEHNTVSALNLLSTW